MISHIWCKFSIFTTGKRRWTFLYCHRGLTEINDSCCLFLLSSGIICNVKQVCSQPKLIQRGTDQTHDEATKLEDDIQKVINQIHSLSGGNVKTRSYSSSPTEESFDLNTYYNSLSNLYGLFQRLLKQKFLDDLPRTLVCILSGKQDCGLEAELTKTVSLELGKPLLAFVSSLRSQTCTPLSRDGGSNSFLNAYLRMEESTTEALNGFQETLVNMLSSLPLSGNVMNAVSGLLDTTVTYVSKLMASLLQTPMDFINIALQFGIRIPSLDGKETCEQGKQSFSIINI